MSNYVFEVAKVRQANQNIWLVGGRALEDIEVGDLVQVDGSPEQKDASQESTAPFSVIAIATSGYGIPVLSSMWTGNLTLQGEANGGIKSGQMLIRQTQKATHPPLNPLSRGGLTAKLPS